jgi:hypothetical protein
MYTFIEVWTPNDSWKNLPASSRRAFMAGVSGAINEMAAAGITTLGWGVNDADTPHRADGQYVAVWQASSREAIGALEAGIASSGWYDYFDQVNVRAELVDAVDIMAEHVDG